MCAITAQCELDVRLEKNILVAKRSLLAKNAVIRSGAECEIVTVDSALRSTGNFDLVEFFLEPAAIASGKFDSGE